MEDEKKDELEASKGPETPEEPKTPSTPAPEQKPAAEDGVASDQAQEAFDQMKKEGKTDDDILAALYIMFAKGDIKEEDLKALIGTLGYDFSDKFNALTDEQKKTEGIPGLDVSHLKEDEKNDEEKSEAFRMMGLKK